MHDLAEMRHICRRRTRICFDCFFQELGSKNHLNIQNQTHILFGWHGWIVFVRLLFKYMLCFGAKPMSDTEIHAHNKCEEGANRIKRNG